MAKTSAKSKGKGKKRTDKSFGINLAQTFFGSVEGYFKALLPITLAGIATTGVAAAGFIFVQDPIGAQSSYGSTALFLGVMTIAGVVALPWFSYALAIAEERKIGWSEPFRSPGRFYAQLVCSFWFWAAFLLGLRYLAGIPSIVAVVFYAFYGYVLADGAVDKGLAALGASVQLGQGRRLGLAAIAGLFAFFFSFGASGFGVEGWSDTARYGSTILGTAVTGSIIMIAGAKIYLVLEKDL